MTSRYDDGTGQLCSVSVGAHDSWTFDIGTTFNPQKTCTPTVCPATIVRYTTALDPPNPYKDIDSLGGVDCSAYQPLPNRDPNWSYCCDPPEDYNGNWPDDYGSNDGQSSPGGDAYGDDFTNMLDYWTDVTDTPAKARRELQTGQSLAYHEWRHKVSRAKSSHDRMRRRQADMVSGAVTRLDKRDNEVTSESPRAKRWFSSFINWLSKITTVGKSNAGFLTMAVQKSVLLNRAFVGCSRTNAHMSIYLDAEAAMDATYAYYCSGALGGVVPTATYAYFAMQPYMYLGLTVTDGARLEYRSPRAKLLPTLSYPGLAIKGLAAVGPTLDVWGQTICVVQISGTMQAGARYTFEQAEIYWPDDGAAAPVLQGLVGDTAEPVASGLAPEFQAAVPAYVDLDINVTPEAHLGIQIGGGSAFGVTLFDAQVVGYVNNTLRFHADATGTISSSTGSAEVVYNYGVYLLYNICYGGWATIVGYTWNGQSHNLFSTPKTITLYSNGDVLSTTFKRDVPLLAGRSLSPELKVVGVDGEGQERGILNSDADGSELGDIETIFARARIIGMDGDVLWTSGDEMINVTCRAAPWINVGPSPDFSLGTLTCLPDSCSSDSGNEKRATSNTCGWVLPYLRYSADAFSDTQLLGYQPGQQATDLGIARNVQNFFDARQLSNSGPITLTWEPAGQNARRDFACTVPESSFGTSYCAVDNYLLSANLGLDAGDTINFLSCDEFPTASSEEGGSFFGTLATGPTAVIDAGSCNGLVADVRTNVAYFDDPTATPNWQAWGSAGKTSIQRAAGGTNPGWFNGAWQRLALYPFQIPKAKDITLAFYGPNAAGEYGGYFLRRNFAMGLTVPRFQSCSVIFSGPTPAPNSKRGLNSTGEANNDDDAVVGTFNGWGVKKVIIHDDPDTAPDFVPKTADLLPADIIRKAAS
ncbi:hypothetical protein N656DRAFT_841568 [Canariomyces notabilis]|uniref:Uncharacterized protein n=1 Tax=Canariomyces notabilis TaxID=2074819 RepID=A0AAN6TK98_9PEZI|nr:hypothetical protein N656DRAFT_841568 [Canariomyces arenarius]